jgi:hypothetical protein
VFKKSKEGSKEDKKEKKEKKDKKEKSDTSKDTLRKERKEKKDKKEQKGEISDLPILKGDESPRTTPATAVEAKPKTDEPREIVFVAKGERISVSVKTLEKFADSPLAISLTGRWGDMEERTVDQDPITFKRVVEWMETGKIEGEELPPTELDSLLMAAEYISLSSSFFFSSTYVFQDTTCCMNSAIMWTISSIAQNSTVTS